MDLVETNEINAINGENQYENQSKAIRQGQALGFGLTRSDRPLRSSVISWSCSVSARVHPGSGL